MQQILVSGSNICKQIHLERKWQHAAVDKRMRVWASQMAILKKVVSVWI